jgi:hypothetical protein
MQYQFASIIAALIVTLGAYAPSYVIAALIGSIGIAGWCMYDFILPQLEKKKAAVSSAVNKTA